MEQFKLLSGGVNFLSLPIVQDYHGVYFINSNGKYYEPVYANWDNGVIPPGYTRKTDGSHATASTFTYGGKTYQQLPWDIYMPAWSIITSNWDWYVSYEYKTYSDPECYVLLTHGDYILLMGHCYAENIATGTLVKAGDILVKTNPSMGHAHVTLGYAGKGVDVMPQLLAEDIDYQTLYEKEVVKNTLLQSQLNQANADLEVQKQLNSQLTERNIALNQEVASLQGINKQLNEKNAELTAENLQLQQQVAKLEADLAEANKTIIINININKQNEDKIANQKMEIDALIKQRDLFKDKEAMTVGQRFEFLIDGIIAKLKGGN